MAVKYAKPKGTQDILPETSGSWLHLEEKLRRTVGLYGYREIRLPTFEHTEVFARGVGETTDVVGKEMYKTERYPVLAARYMDVDDSSK